MELRLSAPGSDTMKWSPERSRVAQTAWFDLRRPDTRDAVALLGAAALFFAVAHIYNLAPKLFQLGADYSEWELDDIIFVVFLMSIAMMVYAIRRHRDLSNEIKSRIGAENEARKLAPPRSVDRPAQPPFFPGTA